MIDHTSIVLSCNFQKSTKRRNQAAGKGRRRNSTASSGQAVQSRTALAHRPMSTWAIRVDLRDWTLEEFARAKRDSSLDITIRQAEHGGERSR
jgi:hypothetical protein